jgi:uncharacterized protein YndB with AHSA1/START domain
MKSTLLFDFSVNKETKTVYIKREFNATLELVWQAWTTAELLDQWCAPNPYRTETKTLDFQEGGFWHYAIISPEGRKHWSRYDYKKIEFQKEFIELRAFSDENGTVDPHFQQTECTLIFSETGGKTLVTIIEKYGNPEMFDKMSSDNYKKGFSSHLRNLDKFLKTK